MSVTASDKRSGCEPSLKRARVASEAVALAEETASVSHAIETIVVKDDEFGVPQQLDVDLYREHVFAHALVDGKQRILRIGPAPQAPVDLQLDDTAAGLEERVGVGDAVHFRAAPPRPGSTERARPRSRTRAVRARIVRPP